MNYDSDCIARYRSNSIDSVLEYCICLLKQVEIIITAFMVDNYFESPLFRYTVYIYCLGFAMGMFVGTLISFYRLLGGIRMVERSEG